MRKVTGRMSYRRKTTELFLYSSRKHLFRYQRLCPEVWNKCDLRGPKGMWANNHGRSSSSAQFKTVGVPHSLQIKSSCSASSLPYIEGPQQNEYFKLVYGKVKNTGWILARLDHPTGNIGLPWSSSANIQPADHISTGGPYARVPRSNSGGLYQSVITRFVKVLEFSNAQGLASPKSASFKTPWLLMSRLDPFMSRCKILFRWQYVSPVKSCFM